MLLTWNRENTLPRGCIRDGDRWQSRHIAPSVLSVCRQSFSGFAVAEKFPRGQRGISPEAAKAAKAAQVTEVPGATVLRPVKSAV